MSDTIVLTQTANCFSHEVVLSYQPGDLTVAVNEGDRTTPVWVDASGLVEMFATGVALGWDAPQSEEKDEDLPFLQIEFENLSGTVDAVDVTSDQLVAAFARGVFEALSEVIRSNRRIESDHSHKPGPASEETPDEAQERREETKEYLAHRQEVLQELFVSWDEFYSSSTPVDQADCLLRFANEFFHFRWREEDSWKI